MSLIGLCLNLLLAVLLLCALTIGVRLEKRLKAVREGQLAFAKAVSELDVAAAKARAGLAELRDAADEATDVLGGRITRARDAADRLEKLLNRADAIPTPPANVQSPPPMGPEGGLSALLERLKAGEITPQRPAAAATPERPAPRRASVDDDLFEDMGGRL